MLFTHCSDQRNCSCEIPYPSYKNSRYPSEAIQSARYVRRTGGGFDWIFPHGYTSNVQGSPKQKLTFSLYSQSPTCAMHALARFRRNGEAAAVLVPLYRKMAH